MISNTRFLLVGLVFSNLWQGIATAQTLESELMRVSPSTLALEAREQGDAARGAVVFFQPFMACSKCHVHTPNSNAQNLLGPDLTTLGAEVTDESLVESILAPSKVIRKGFESATILTQDGKALTALILKQEKDRLTVRNVAQPSETQVLNIDDLETWKMNELSIMPAGQVNQLTSRQQFLDLVRYLMEIRVGGKLRAQQLQPSAALLAFTVPEYENAIDHAGFIRDWNDKAFKRGEAIYQRVCMNCHGTHEKPGSLPTSLRFAEGKFKNGSDPFAMYRTLTHGFGQMVPQTWMVPSQKYDVIHYIREAYLKDNNPSQYVTVDKAYLEKLPIGNTRGPEPSNIESWSAMDYGTRLTHTYEIPGAKENFAYKGIAIRLDPGAGGISRGKHWMIFDTDTLRMAAAWEGTGNSKNNFIDWHAIQFDGAHGVHPRIVGETIATNSTGPGWGEPTQGQFKDDQRVLGRDGKRYGPLPRHWGKLHGVYHSGDQVLLKYSVGDTEVLELPGSVAQDDSSERTWYTRSFNLVGSRDHELVLQVAEHAATDAMIQPVREGDPSLIRFGTKYIKPAGEKLPKIEFDGSTFLEVPIGNDFDITTKDFSIAARIKTIEDGSICSFSDGGAKWVPDGQSLFLRGGRVTYDIGWVGAVSGKTKVNDGEWHTIVMSWQQNRQMVRLFVDGKLDGEGKLAANKTLAKQVMRIGFTAPNFPRPKNYFRGQIAELRFYARELHARELDEKERKSDLTERDDTGLQGEWLCEEVIGDVVKDMTSNHHDALIKRESSSVSTTSKTIFVGITPSLPDLRFESEHGQLRLRIPSGAAPLRFTLAFAADSPTKENEVSIDAVRLKSLVPHGDRDLNEFTQGGPRRWQQALETRLVQGEDRGAFAADILTPPESNPWLAQTRFTGLDFLPDGRLAVCTWDGDVWLVAESNQTLRWQRIASGMFQPLGLKIVEGKIHVICRDQLTVLHDLNGDEEIDFYECLNNDHQVTEHFHEFAMGLQTDEQGNFYYAKSGCHGKAAVVPHHGTLLKVSKDGSKTEILANGFRAANGVCLNPDGSFVVTDQEGFWNPKNRINWVTLNPNGKPNFYGNMLGYHDVTDASDAAMEPPLCWITNAFDRSPAELLWVNSDRWGALKGSLLNLSYGYGKVFLVPHEKVNGMMQGGMIELPIPAFPTGVMRGRFSDKDGELYLCGMFAWAGNATHPGGLYRLRATGHAMHLPTGLHATKEGIQLQFTEPLAADSVDATQVQVKSWSLQRTANYGSKHFNEKTLEVQKATLSADGKSVRLIIGELAPTWCMEIVYSFRSATGETVQGTIHNTIHHLAPK